MTDLTDRLNILLVQVHGTVREQTVRDALAEIERLTAKIEHTTSCAGCPDCIGIGMRQQLNAITEERDEARKWGIEQRTARWLVGDADPDLRLAEFDSANPAPWEKK